MGTYNNITPNPVSPNMNPVYFRSNFIPYATISINNVPYQVMDIANNSYLQIINNLKAVSVVNSVNYTLPVLAYKTTETTSTWWMIGILNGLIHPLQLQEGQLVLLPDVISAISNNNSTISNSGSVVTF